MIHLLTLSVLGCSLLWSIRLVYGNRTQGSDDAITLCATIAGWLLIFAGITAVAPPLLLPAVVVAGMVATAYRNHERRLLLWSLALASRGQSPLSETCRSFAQGRIDEVGRRIWRLSELLDAGLPLPEALRKSNNKLPKDAELAVRLGYETGCLDQTLIWNLQQERRMEQATRAIYTAFIYLLISTIFFLSMLLFLSQTVMPQISEIFTEFGVRLPASTAALLQLSGSLGSIAWLLIGINSVTILLFLYILILFMGYRLPEPPLLRRLSWRLDAALVLATLADWLQQQRPIDASLELIPRSYPSATAKKRLLVATDRIRQGSRWHEALAAAGYLQPHEVGLLRASESAGNLPWALHELSHAKMRRLNHRANMLARFAMPFSVLLLALPVAWFAVGVVSPLSQIVQALA